VQHHQGDDARTASSPWPFITLMYARAGAVHAVPSHRDLAAAPARLRAAG
jgi:hypothetical protein